MSMKRTQKQFFTATRKLTALTLFAALLTGCASSGEYPQDLTLSTEEPPALSRDENRESSFEAQLFFVSEDGRKLFSETREISCDGNMSRAEAALRAMQEGPVSDTLTDSVAAGLRFSGIELSRDACNVYYEGAFEDIKEWLVLRAAIAATVKAAENIDTVNVYCNGVAPGYNGRALGALAPISGALDTYLSDLRQEYETLAQGNTEAGGRETRTATLYFTNLDGTLLIARNRRVSYDFSAGKIVIIKALLEDLLEGDSGSESLEPVLPADLQLAQEPEIVYLSDLEKLREAWQNATPTPIAEEPEPSPSPTPSDPNKASSDRDEACIVKLVFYEPSMDFDEKMMCGALTLMLTGYIPKTAGVKISLLRTDAEGLPYEVSLSLNDYFVRDDFTSYIGHSIHLAFPDAEGTVLNRVERIVPSDDAYDPDARLKELFYGPADPGVMHPDVFSQSDVLDVYIVDDLAVVNWKAGFAEKLKALSEQIAGRQEDLFIFGVINTLTEMPGVSRVWMLEDGKRLEAAGNLYLGNALLRNPGILIEGTTS